MGDSSLSQDGNEDLEVGRDMRRMRRLTQSSEGGDCSSEPPKYFTHSGTNILETRPLYRRPTSEFDDDTETDSNDFTPTPVMPKQRSVQLALSRNSSQASSMDGNTETSSNDFTPTPVMPKHRSVRSTFSRNSSQASSMAASLTTDAWFNLEEDYWLPPPAPSDSPLQVDFRCACFKLTDVSTVSFTAMIKFVVIFEWEDPRIRGKSVTTNDLPGDLWGPDIVLENAQNDISVIYDSFSLISQETGRLKRTVTFHGNIFNPMSLKDFPFDNDDVELKFISICNWRTLDESRHGNDPVKQVYILKPILDRSDVPFFLLGWGGKVNEFKMLGWKEAVINPETPGPPIIFKFDIQLSRKWQYYVWKVCVPLWLIVLTSIAPYGIEPADFQGKTLQVNNDRIRPASYFILTGRLEVIFTLLLSSVALLYVVQESIPKISFLTVIDKVVIASLVSLAVSVLFAYLIKVWKSLNLVLAVVDQLLYWIANICILVPPYVRYRRYIVSVVAPEKPETERELMKLGRMKSSINIKRSYSFKISDGKKRQLSDALSLSTRRSQKSQERMERIGSTQSFGQAKRTFSLTPSKTLCTQEVESILEASMRDNSESHLSESSADIFNKC